MGPGENKGFVGNFACGGTSFATLEPFRKPEEGRKIRVLAAALERAEPSNRNSARSGKKNGRSRPRLWPDPSVS